METSRQQANVLGRLAHAILGNTFGTSWGITKCKADSLLAQILFRNRFLPRRLECLQQFRIGLYVSHELFAIRHYLITFFRHLFGFPNSDNNPSSSCVRRLPVSIV